MMLQPIVLERNEAVALLLGCDALQLVYDCASNPSLVQLLLALTMMFCDEPVVGFTSPYR